MPSYAVLGASRGIGLEYVLQLARRSDAVVFAIVRNPEGSTYLQPAVASLKNVHIFSGDVADYSTLERAANQVSEITGGKLDYLIHNAAKSDAGTAFEGFDDYSNMEDLDNAFISAFKVNSLGPIHSIIAFLPLLRASDSKKVIVLGSCADDPDTVKSLKIANPVAYGMTKAAAHIATTKLAKKLKDEGFVVVTLDPGFVDTSGTASQHDLDVLQELSKRVKRENRIQTVGERPEEAVVAHLRVIDGLETAHNGLYLSHTGGEYRAPT
ncbi:hypothetical protein V8D89_006757 [Ganoderma adspersum]